MISILVSILGFSIIKHEFKEIFRDFGLKKVFFYPTLFFLAVALLILLKKFYFSPIWFWFLTVMIYLLVYFSPQIIKLRMESEIKDQILHFLDYIIQNVQLGLSMKASVIKALDEFDGWKKTQFSLLAISVFSGKQNDGFTSKSLRFLHQELSQIEKSKTKNLEQLKNYRQQLKIEKNLRHRSRQVMQNLKIQSVVMTILYFLIGMFIFSNFETSKSKFVLILSAVIFSFGQIFVFFIGKNLKWKT